MKFTAEAYHDASLEHIASARILFEQRRYALVTYIAGVAVECIFRAYSLRFDKSFDSRHDLDAWYEAARFDSMVPFSRREEVAAAQGTIATHWSNNLRYCSLKFLRAHFRLLQLDRGLRGNFEKELCRRTVEAAFVLVTLGDHQWNNSSKK